MQMTTLGKYQSNKANAQNFTLTPFLKVRYCLMSDDSWLYNHSLGTPPKCVQFIVTFGGQVLATAPHAASSFACPLSKPPANK